MKLPSVRRLPFFVGVGLLLVAALLFERPWTSNDPTTAVPLDVPLTVTDAIKWQGEFITKREGTYDFVLAISGRDDVDARYGECLLGGGIDAARGCLSTPSVVDLTWRLQRNGQTTQESTNAAGAGRAIGRAMAMSYSPGLIERHITEFTGSPGESFALFVTSSADLSPLTRFKPRLRVRASTFLMEESALEAAVWDIGAALVFLCGLWAVAVGFVMRRQLHAV